MQDRAEYAMLNRMAVGAGAIKVLDNGMFVMTGRVPRNIAEAVKTNADWARWWISLFLLQGNPSNECRELVARAALEFLPEIETMPHEQVQTMAGLVGSYEFAYRNVLMILMMMAAHDDKDACRIAEFLAMNLAGEARHGR